MIRPITTTSVTSTGTVTCSTAIIGAVIPTTDGTNVGTVTLRKNNSVGQIILTWAAKEGIPLICQLEASKTVYYSVSGTGYSVMLYEYVP